MSTPGEKREFEDRESSNDLTHEEAFRFRAIVARGNYLAQDRTDVQYAVKELSRRMPTPKECDWVSAKRLGRYLIGRTRSVLHFGYQDNQSEVVVWSDTDFAGCRNERKSTSGGVVMLGSHCLKSWSLTQKVIALSSGEAEYYGLAKSGSQGVGIRALLGDLGVVCTVVLNTDASAAIGIASRRGLGKVRHIEVSQLWLQHRVASGDLRVQKVDGVSNSPMRLRSICRRDPWRAM